MVLEIVDILCFPAVLDFDCCVGEMGFELAGKLIRIISLSNRGTEQDVPR